MALVGVDDSRLEQDSRVGFDIRSGQPFAAVVNSSDELSKVSL